MPLFEQAKIVLLPYCNRTIYDGITTDLIQDFIEQEYSAFPVSQHDDMLDALSRICDEKELGLHCPQTDLKRIQRQADRPISYTGGANAMSMWERHKAKIAGRGTGQRPGARPQERLGQGTGLEVTRCSLCS